jgi:hypothetical protein
VLHYIIHNWKFGEKLTITYFHPFLDITIIIRMKFVGILNIFLTSMLYSICPEASLYRLRFPDNFLSPSRQKLGELFNSASTPSTFFHNLSFRNHPMASHYIILKYEKLVRGAVFI